MLLTNVVDLAYVPPTLMVDNGDAISQDDIRFSVRNTAFTADEYRLHYDALHPSAIHLSTLKRMYTKNERAEALRLVNGVHYLIVDDSFTYKNDDPTLNWAADDVRTPLHWLFCLLELIALSQVRLDYIVLVPKHIGVDTVLPNARIPSVRRWVRWSFVLSFTNYYWEYRGAREVLNFDPAERMLHAGRVDGSTDVFFAWIPEHAVMPDADPSEVVYSKKSTVMSPTLRRLTQAFVAYAMYRMHYSDVYQLNNYPDISSHANFKNTSPIL